MGLSSKKTKTTPIVSDWMMPTLTSQVGRIEAFAGKDPQQFVAPASELQTKAFGDAANLGGWQPVFSQARSIAGDAAAQGPSSATAYRANTHSIFDDGGIQRYIDPATQNTIDPALRAFDHDRDKRFGRMQADAARNGAFGGSRYGVAQGTFDAESALGRAAMEAEMRRIAYAQGLDTAQQDADRRQQTDMFNAGQETQVSQTNAGLQEQRMLRALQAAGLLGDIGNNLGAHQRDDIALTSELGGIQRGIASENLNAEPAQLQLLANLIGGIPVQTYAGSKTKQSGMGYVWDNLIKAADTAASAYSAFK